MVGEVDVFGQHNYSEVWNHERFVAKLHASRSPTTTRARWRSSGSESMVAHEPVMAAEVVELLAPVRGGVFLDCTVGSAGTRAPARARRR
jgi:hypothetical protein